MFRSAEIRVRSCVKPILCLKMAETLKRFEKPLTDFKVRMESPEEMKLSIVVQLVSMFSQGGGLEFFYASLYAGLYYESQVR